MCDIMIQTLGVDLQVRKQMEEQVAQKSTELEQYLQRVRELEDMYGQLEDALDNEKRARQEEEAVRRLQARWVHRGGGGGGGGRRSYRNIHSLARDQEVNIQGSYT